MSEAVTRRSFATAAALSFAGVGAGVSLWPLLATLAPNPASPGPDVASVDLARVQAGDTLRVAWRGLPVLVRHRTPAEIERARSVRLDDFRDRLARNANRDARAVASDGERLAATRAEWLVVVGVCTREPCLLIDPELAARLADGVGWFCPCCAARYDLSGRVVSGPAPQNLAIPRYVIEGMELRVGIAARTAG